MTATWYRWSCFITIIFATNLALSAENNAKLSNLKRGLKLLQEQVGNLDLSFRQLFTHLKNVGELVVKNQKEIQQCQSKTNQIILESRVAENVSLVTNFSKQILNLQTICTNANLNRTECYCNPETEETVPISTIVKPLELSLINSCAETNSTISGLFKMKIPNIEHPVVVLCELQRFGGGWLVIQQRYDGSVDFYQNWTEYRNGFGMVGGEFWLGLEPIYQLTKQRTYELMIELETFKGGASYARYTEFTIGAGGEKYPLLKVGNYSGTTGDHLTRHEGMKFTTFDNDNDIHDSDNCAVIRQGAWWYTNCVTSNLNGKFWDNSNTTVWSGLGNKYTRMMIRKKFRSFTD